MERREKKEEGREMDDGIVVCLVTSENELLYKGIMVGLKR